MDVVGTITITEDGFLYIRRIEHASMGGMWGVPGGRVEAGEAFAEAAARELREETGISKDPSNLIKICDFDSNIVLKNGQVIDVMAHTFLVFAGGIGLEDVKLAVDEHAEKRIFSLDELDVIRKDLLLKEVSRSKDNKISMQVVSLTPPDEKLLKNYFDVFKDALVQKIPAKARGLV